MENINIKISCLVAFLICSCSSYKKALKMGEGTIDDAIENVIINYSHVNNKRMNKGNIFILQNRSSEKDEFYNIAIGYYINKVILRSEHTIGSYTNYIPTKYKIYNDHLFLWNDSIQPINHETLNMLDKYDRLDSTYVKLAMGLIDSNNYTPPRIIMQNDLKYKIYLVCKNEINNYKAIITNNSIPIEKIKLPKMNCN